MVEGIQYGGGISSIRWKIFSTDVSHHQYEGGASSIQLRACSIDLSHHQYRGGWAVHDGPSLRIFSQETITDVD